MTRSGFVLVAASALLLVGCSAQLVELPLNRAPAPIIALNDGPLRCPRDTVFLDDRDASSGAGALPEGFAGVTLLRCEVRLATAGEAQVGGRTVRQWQAPAKPGLRAALNLPDREFRPAQACAGSTSAVPPAVYVVDADRRAVRVVLPVDDPCQKIRAEVVTLLPANGSPADATFRV